MRKFLEIWIRYAPTTAGAVLLAAGAMKPLNWRPVETILALDGFPASMIQGISVSLVVMEILLGYALVLKLWNDYAIKAAIALYSVFVVQLMFLLATATETLSCGCFGPFSPLVGTQGLIAQTGLDLAILGGLIMRQRRRSQTLIESFSTTEPERA